jgi:hypothetical protein
MIEMKMPPRSRTVVLIASILALVLLTAPAFAAQDEPKGRIQIIEDTIQFLEEQIAWLQLQIDSIQPIPGPAGAPGEQGESGITDIVTEFHSFNPVETTTTTPTDIPNAYLEVSVEQPTDVVVLYTAHVVAPMIDPEDSRATLKMRLKIREVGAPFWLIFRHFTLEANAGIRQFNFHVVVPLSEAGDYELQLDWYHNRRDLIQDWSWDIQDTSLTAMIPRGQ